MIRLLIFLTILFNFHSLHAQTNVIDQQARKEKQKEVSPWLSGVGYSFQTDLNDPVEPRQATHFLSAYGGYNFGRSIISAGLSGAYVSYGQDIDASDNSQESFLNDIYISGNRNWVVGKGQFISASLTNEFPTSADARREGYLSVTSAGLSYFRAIFKGKVILGSGLGGNYIWNTYETSPYSNQVNRLGGARLGLSMMWFYYKRFFIRVSGGSQLSTYADGTSDQVYRHTFSTGLRDGQWSVRMAYTNGSYLDDNDAQFWYLDQYRQLLSFGIAYNF